MKRMLELGAHEPISIAGVLQDEEVDFEDGQVHCKWQDDETQESREEMLHPKSR